MAQTKMSGPTNPVLDYAIISAAKHKVRWLEYLPKGKTEYSSREVLNAIGQALTAAGITNNFYKAPESAP